MKLFPTVEALAHASEESVIKAWEGLGYYSRARNLHAGAKFLSSAHGGRLPDTYEALSAMKGLGAYTTGAILSFAFKQKALAIDGNVQRVAARLFHITEDVTRKEGKSAVEGAVLELIEDKEPWILTEALIELGALVCKKKPDCAACPAQKLCASYALGDAEELPIKPKPQKSIPLFRAPLVIERQGQLLVRKTPPGEIMHGLYEFPFFDTTPQGPSLASIKNKLSEWGIKQADLQTLGQVQHGFTRYRVRLFPTLVRVQDAAVPGFTWVSKNVVSNLSFSSGHRKILSDSLRYL